MSRKSPADVEEALIALQSVQRAVMAATWGRWADLDLTMHQIKALHVLGQCGELSVGALAERQGTKLPAASVLADNLVQAGLIERSDDPQDRRRVQLRLTDRGEEIVRRPREVGQLISSWLEKMEPEELAALTRGLQTLAEVSGANVNGPASWPWTGPGARARDRADAH
jgi:MarR family transcriptional regulator, organic hydroperoxide resistance regulator